MKTLQRTFSLLVVLILLAGALGPAAAGSAQLARVQQWIVQGRSAEAASRLVTAQGGQVTAMLPIVNGVAASMTVAQAQALRQNPAIVAVVADAPVQLVSVGKDGKKGGGDQEQSLPWPASIDTSARPEGINAGFVSDFATQVNAAADQRHNENGDDGEGGDGWSIPATDAPDVIGADLAWQEGYDGSGVTVAIVDTGIGLHPGVIFNSEGQIRLVGWKDFVQHKHWPTDPNGHGTHVAGIIADSMVGADGEYNGVAPNVNLVAVRVLDKKGFGTYSRVLQGIQWVVNHKDDYNIKVMNLSLVSPVQSPYWADPLNQAVMQAWADGITVVVAAGNGGPSPMSVGVPGNNPYVITAGAFTDNYTPADWNDDYITPFSASGPTLDGFVKPDVIAPGAHIVSTMLPGTYLDTHGQAQKVAPGYYWMAGTSQAAAVVSGVAALTLSANSGLSPDEVKFRIQATAFPWVDPNTGDAGYSIWQQGFGRLNALDAVTSAEVDGFAANAGMDIAADLAGTVHYEGYSYYDEATGTFKLQGYGSWAGGYGSWAGGYGSWAGGYGSWAGGYGSWAGSEPWAGSVFSTASFVQDFLAGVAPDVNASSASIGVTSSTH